MIGRLWNALRGVWRRIFLLGWGLHHGIVALAVMLLASWAGADLPRTALLIAAFYAGREYTNAEDVYNKRGWPGVARVLPKVAWDFLTPSFVATIYAFVVGVF